MASSASYRVMLNTTDLHYNNTDALREWLRAHKLPLVTIIITWNHSKKDSVIYGEHHSD